MATGDRSKPGGVQDVEEDYGLIRPSLIKQLRSILDQYPDDGQILKELIQNAEDAGASEVKFLYDETHYDTDGLHHPDMAQFQGPALLAYNNARFEDKDWTGIRLLQDSVKENDPLKVGRFGLGFKSVLHMTDLPSVVSGDRLFMIDPHEKYFQFRGDKTSGYSWHLKQKQAAMASIPNQFQPYVGMFGSTNETFKSGFYDGTLFRFPLRTKESELSATVYDSDRMIELLTSFESDAHTLLLFLKHLEHIGLYRKLKGQSEPKLLFEMKLSQDCLQYVRKKRQAFKDKCRMVDMPNGVTLTYVVFVETIKYHDDGATDRNVYKWLINEYKAGSNVSVELQSLQKDPSLPLVPLVGVAMEVDRPKAKKESQTSDPSKDVKSDLSPNGIASPEQEESDKPEGQVFCFLPLPIEQKTATGLPVHVNGYFAISQNRRHLKWPTTGHNVKSDKSILWNQCLLHELVPLSYTQLLLQATQLALKDSLVKPEDVYAAMPDLVNVDEKWQIVLEPLFKAVFKHPVIYTKANGGCWIKIDAVIFDCMKEDKETSRIVTDVLLRCAMSVAKVPKHVLHALGAYSQNSLEIVSPALVRAAITEKPDSYLTVPRKDSLLLLRYCLKDEDFQEMIGIRLLPLANQKLMTFQNYGEAVYIPTHDAPRDLFPGLESCLLADDLDDLLKNKLAKVANEGITQLRYVDKEATAMLIPKVIPKSWYSQEVVTLPTENSLLKVDWLEHFWTYLRKQYPTDITIFSGLPVLPLSSVPPLQLVPLTISSPCVMQSAMGVVLEKSLLPTLEIFGIHVIKELPDYVQSHAAVIGNFVKLPFREDLVEVLYQSYRRSNKADRLFTQLATETSPLEKMALVKMIAAIAPGTLSTPTIQFLRKLPVFPSIQSTDEKPDYVSIEAVPRGTDISGLPCSPSQRLVDVSDSTVANAAKLLAVVIMEKKEVLTSFIFMDIKQSKLGSSTVNAVMENVFSSFSEYSKDADFLRVLSDVAFVTADRNKMKKPTELVDPRDDLLRDLCTGEEGMFPCNEYVEPQMLIHLCKLGLRTTKTMTSKDILEYMFRVEDFHADEDKIDMVPVKSRAILRFLCLRPELLCEDTQGKMLLNWAYDIAWVPILQKKPAMFPDALEWHRDHLTAKPSQVSCIDHAPLLGSVRAIVDGAVVENVQDMFGWTENPQIDVVISQMARIVESYVPAEKAKFLGLLTSVYEFLLKRDVSEVSTSLQATKLKNWIWHGDGFVAIDSCVAQKLIVDLTPFVHCLPSEMFPFVKLFLSQGMMQQCSPERMIQVLKQISDGLYNVDDHGLRNEKLLQQAIDILNYLKEQSLTEHLRKQILFPVHCELNSAMKMLPVMSCTYCDVDWIRQGFDLMEFDEQDGITFIHANVPISTADKLGVPTLMSRMLHAEELAITGFGQGEPLTCRLKQLLDDYSDGLAIFKEMIQNADDAGATEISFLYDERMNEDSMKYLIDEGMKDCQGPSLWIHNNSVFSDQDFQNITKLGGATKELEPEKIGRFGLGFNAVYNITDVPSFVSRNNIVIFDPHTTHLGKGIKDRSRPGIKIDMTKNKTLLKKLSDQFRPYQDIFGCTVQAESGGYYDGTLFRLPLRTKRQAANSEISGLHYDHKEMISLLNLMVKHAHNLTLFTQNLTKVKLFHIPADGTPADAREVFILEKNIEKILRQQAVAVGKTNSGGGDGDKQMAFLTAAAKYIKQTKRPMAGRLMSVPPVPQSTLLVHTSTRTVDNVLGLNMEGSISNQYWLISGCVGQEDSKKMAMKSRNNLVPLGGVAIHLRKSDKGFVPVHVSSICKGLTFCFLPLPIPTGLPVHINGTFALESSRKHLSQRSDDDKEDMKAEWNEVLLGDAVAHAYMQGLWDLKQVLPFEEEVFFYDIWPTFISSEPYFQPLVTSFYKNMSTLLQMPLCSRDGVIVSMSNAVFLESSKSVSPKMADCLMKAFSQCCPGKHVLSPPDAVIKSFESAGYSNLLAEKHYDLHRFYDEIFFPNIAVLDCTLRDILIIFALQLNKKDLNRLLTENACIPSSPDGKVLKKIDELTHPTGLASRLYTEDDGRFPHGEAFVSGNVLGYLQKLGLKVNEVTWEDLVERAESVQSAYEVEAALGKNRLHNVLAFIDRKILQTTKSIQSYKGQQELSSPDYDDEMLTSRESLRNVKFIPVLEKPKAYPVSWKGDETRQNELFHSGELYSKDSRYLISATQLIANEEHMTLKVKEFLGLTKRDISIEQVMTQLEHVLVIDLSLVTRDEERNEIQKSLNNIYSYIQELLNEGDEMIDQLCLILQERPCILVENRFFIPTKLAMNFQYDCSPYLYALPQDTLRRFRPLMTKIGVKENFDTRDYVEVLQLLNSEAKEKVLNERQLDVSLRVTSQLNNNIKSKGMDIEQVIENYGEIYIPNAKGILQPSRSLCYNDCPWIEETQVMNFTHPDITFSTSASLGVKTKRQEALRKYAIGIPFGQKERLTNSLKRILDTYPCDHEILKEMIQNADDAQATEIHFVRDSRNHPTEHVFETSWKPLQGPALCVYNNKTFSLEDLDGIQRLGEGSKSRDPSKTGQYGIGFSSVYHLTDVPSLLTTSSAVGKTLCVFDPHCYYVPGASPAEPGMRFENVEKLQAAFPDVFNCYLPEDFDVTNGTMFRLPLRTMSMAETSKISKQHITMSRIHRMLENLKSEAFDILLFTNYLETIKISDIDPLTGKMINTYTVTISLSELQRKMRFQLAENVKKYGQELKLGTSTLTDISRQEYVYCAYLTDTLGRQEKWCISQLLGFQIDQEIPEVVTEAYDEGNLALMPRGGVACLLEERINGQPDTSNRSMKAFCFLPLPVKTNLPVHVNAHFALGHENRRHLWMKNEGTTSYRNAWNFLICSTVIADSYINLLKEIRMHGLASSPNVVENSQAVVTCSRQILDSSIDTYMSCFPSFSDDQPEWNSLVRNVYLHIAENKSLVLPAVQEHVASDGTGSQVHGTQWCVTWLSPVGEGMEKAFFNKPESDENMSQTQASSFLSRFRGIFKGAPKKHVKTESQILQEVLLDCGLKWVNANPSIVQNFITSGVDIDFLSPHSVMKFLGTYSNENSMCKLGTLPCKLSETPFNDESTLTIILRYCKKDEDFFYKLEGLPLLLTEDGLLRVFDVDKPVFHSSYSDLVPERGDLFIKKSMVTSVFQDTDLTACPVFKKLDIDEFNVILPMKLPVAQLRTGEPVAWSRGYNSVPSLPWLKKFWTFVREDSKPKQAISENGSPEELEKQNVEKVLSPLSEWSLLPAQTSTRNYLYPLSMAKDIIYHAQVDYKWQSVREVLRKLKLPELDTMAVNLDNSANCEIAKSIVTTLDKPESVLNILRCNLVGNDKAPILTKQEANRLLAYFVDSLERLQEDETNAVTLRDLPIYTTIYGDVIPLTNCLVYTLPAKIPTEGIDIWQSHSGTVFLERNNDFQTLYDYLGCASISVLDVYCQFIFQHLEYFPEEDRMVHLYHVYSKYIKDGAPNRSDLTDEERDNLQTVLKEMSFVDDGSGDLQPASEFYDPENVVFKVMLSEDKFPPPPKGHLFKESEWYDFLAKLGLVREMNRDMFVQYANQVANEGHIHDKNSALAKSKVLVQHLYTMSAASKEAIMPDIADIKFVSQGEATPALSELHAQYGDIGTGTLHFTSFRDSISKKHEKLVWTQACLLPGWADPCEQHNLQQLEKEQIMAGLQIQKSPKMQVVAQHLLTLCHHISSDSYHLDVASVKTNHDVFKAIYRFLQDNLADDNDMKEKLAKEPIILVSSKQLVKPCQTVVNLFEGDEIRPYLYKIPLHLGEFAQFFKSLGATERASVDQYGRVLEAYKKKFTINRLTINGLRGVFKAMKGLLEALESHTSRDVSVPVLYLPNEQGYLVDASKLVYNDAPSFYDRVREFNLQFVVDPRECGLKTRNADELLALLPQRVRPGMLSAFAKEELMEDCKHSKIKAGLAKVLDERVRSEIFLTAVARLVRHEAQKTGQKVDDINMFQVLDRLSTIHVSGVDRVMTHLTFKSRHIEGSEVEKACYVEKLQGFKNDFYEWHLYIRKDSTLSQDLLVPLAEIINSILSGMLRDSVLYLLPILSCPMDEIQTKLDSLNIRLDRVLPESRILMLPSSPDLGTPVGKDLLPQLKEGELDFEAGEFVGFKQGDPPCIIHAQIKEELMSPSDKRLYLISAGQDQSAVIALSSYLFKYH